MAEATVVRAVVRVLDDAGAVHFNLNGANGETGLCDRLAFYRGRTLWIECKSASGRVRPKQAWMAQRVAAHGVIALVVRDGEQVRAELRRIDEEHALKYAERPAKPVEFGDESAPALVAQPGARHPNTGGSNAAKG
jgi:hypothetical protein